MRRQSYETLRLLLQISLVCLSHVGKISVQSVEGSEEETECWTGWISRDDPSGTGDWELRSSMIKENRLICERPTNIQCRTKVDHINSSETGQVITCTPVTGLICRNVDQKRGTTCHDYEVNFLCPCQSQEETTKKCGGVVDARVLPLGQLKIDSSLAKPYTCRWRIRTEKGHRVRFAVLSPTPSFRTQFNFFDGKSRRIAPLLYRKAAYSYHYSTNMIVSTKQSLTLVIKVEEGDSHARQLQFWYMAVKAPILWKGCDFETDSCRWNTREANWKRVSCTELLNKVESYSGKISVTESGRTCQAWESLYPHRHQFYSVEFYPELVEANNYCRNPGRVMARPWCYTVDPNKRWEYCAVGRSMCENGESSRLHLVKLPGNQATSTEGPFEDTRSHANVLVSPLLKGLESKCLKFNFRLNVNASVRLLVDLVDIKLKVIASLVLEGTESKAWYLAYLKIPDNVEFYIKFRVNGLTEWNWKTDDIAIDNLGKTTCTSQDHFHCGFGTTSSCPVQFSNGAGKWILENRRSSRLLSTSSSSLEWKNLGCWQQENLALRFSSLESHIDLLPYFYDYSGSHEKRCAVAAHALGFSRFMLDAWSSFRQCFGLKDKSLLNSTAMKRTNWCYSSSTAVYKVYKLTNVTNLKKNAKQYKNIELPAYSFILPKKTYTSSSSSKSYLSLMLTPSLSRRRNVCIAFSYKTSFNDARVTVTDFTSTSKPNTRTVWKIASDQIDTDSSSVWQQAYFSLSSASPDLVAQNVRFFSHEGSILGGGNFKIRSIKILEQCSGKVSNCSFSSYSFCGWEFGPKSEGNFYRFSLDTGNLRFLRRFLPAKKGYAFLQSPPLEKTYRCFSMQYKITNTLLRRFGWGYRMQVIVNGEIYADREIKQDFQLTSREEKWRLEKVDIPQFIHATIVQIRVLLCYRCEGRFKNFLLTILPCSADVDECALKANNSCSHTCENSFGDYDCSCPRYYYKLSSDKRTCQYSCNPSCKNGGTCYQYNQCACPNGYIKRDCSLYCGDPVLKNLSGQIDLNFNVFYGFYSPYQAVTSCSWEIHAPREQKIAFEIIEFVPRYRRCSEFNVTITSEKNLSLQLSTNTFTACRTTANPITKIRSQSNRLFISYYASAGSYIANPNFKARYHITDGSCVHSCRNLEWWQRCCHTYVVATPNVLRQGTTAEIHIMTQGIGNLSTFNAHLVSNDKVVLKSFPADFKENGYGLAKFEIPVNFSPGKYELVIEGVGADKETKLSGMTDVGVAVRGPVAFVQTDKPVYKPGQQVRMRVIVLDFKMKPYTENITIEIADGKGTKVLQWLNLIPRNGIVRLSFSLSSQPVAGTWTVFVYAVYAWTSKPILIKDACFKVQEYVLPKFEVNVLLPEYLLFDEKNLYGAVSARYTYGKLVTGQACLDISSVHQEFLRIKPSREKTCFDINGLTDFTVNTFNLIGKWLSRYFSDYYIPTALEVNVTVTEKGTGAVANGSEIVTVAKKPFAINFFPGTSSYFTPGLPLTATFSIVLPNRRPLLNRTEVFVEIRGDGKLLEKTTVETANGTATMKVFYQKNLFRSSIEIKASFATEGEDISASHLLKPKELVNAQRAILFSSSIPALQPGNETVISLFSTQPVSTDLHLIAIGRGQIFRSWKVSMQSEPSLDYDDVYEFKMAVTASCSQAPNFYLVAYYVDEKGVGIGDFVKLQVARCFEQKVDISFSRNASRPAEQVELFVKASPFSHVSITAVDKSVYLVPSSCTGSQLSAEKVLSEMGLFETGYDESTSGSNEFFEGSGYDTENSFWWKSWWANVELPEFFKNPGVAIITNLKLSTDYRFVKRQINKVSLAASGFELLSAENKDSPSIEDNGFAQVQRVRSYFPEAWLWSDHQTDEKGELTLNVTVPDTITSWIADAFAMSLSSGFGIASVPARLVAFKPFFVSLSLPYSVIRGEEVAIIATVFNYFYEDLKVIVELDVQIGGFEFIGNASRIPVFVQAQDSRTVRFPIVPKRLGRIPLKTTAYSTIESDAVLRFLLVEPEGKEESYFLSILTQRNKAENFFLSLPDNIVPGSAMGKISISGDFLGPAIGSLGGLLIMPYGCGEQNIASFSPSVLVKRYLQITGLLTPEIDSKATRYIQRGYQRQLTFRRNDGSYAAWGQYASSGSTCLTTFVLRVYVQMTSVAYVDRNDMARSACWIINQQKEDGSFAEPGYCYHLRCGREDFSVALTAYSLATLYEINTVAVISCSQSLSQTLSKGIQFLKSQINSRTSDYVKALAAYTLVVINEVNTANTLLEELDRSAIVNDKGSERHWECRPSYYRYGCSRRFGRCYVYPGSIEATAYAMLAYVEKGNLLSAIPIRNWLLAQMDSRGGWRSSQDSVLALMALSLMSIRTGTASGLGSSLNIEITIPRTFNKSVTISDENRIITRRFDIPLPSTVEIKPTGNGTALVQATVIYNVPVVPPELSFEINATMQNKVKQNVNKMLPSKSDLDDNRLELKTCVRWNRESDSSMCIVEIGILSGFKADEDSLKALVTTNDMSLQRYEIEGRKVIFYFDEIRSDRIICFNTSFTRSHCVSKLQPAFIQVYAYYEPDFLTVISYNPPKTISDSLDECEAPGEKEVSEESSASGQNESVNSGSPTLETISEEDEAFLDTF